jgi:hypothetical protein
MATLNIIGLNGGQPIWLWTTLNVLKYLDDSHIRNLCHGNQIDIDPLSSSSKNYTIHPSPSSGESLATRK